VGAVRWQTAQRAPSRLLDAAVTDTAQHGAVLMGAAGVGKTVLARAGAGRFTRRHPSAASHWISATASASRVPFGAFSHLLRLEAGEPAALLSEARSSLCRDAHGVLIVVDDAHLLDNLSATLVHQLAVTGSARLILTTRSDEPVPDAITTLWKDSLVTRIDVGPFDSDQTASLVEKALGGPLEAASANRIFKLSKGNPLYVRHLVEGAVTTGALREVDGVWQLRGDMALTPQLSDLIGQHLSTMSGQVQSVLEYLSVEEPLPLTDLAAVAGRDAIEEAEAIGAVTVTPRGSDLVVQSGHPLYTESLRASMGTLAARRIRTVLVERLSARGPAHVSDRLRLAALAIESDHPPEVSAVIGSAWEAMRLGDLALGERLARGAVDRDDGLPARLALAHSLSWQGRGRETDDVLTPVDISGLSEWELTAWMLPKAANQFWMLKESEDAVAFLSEMRQRISDPAPLNTIDSLRATFAMNSGDPARAVELAREVLASPSADDLAVAWASSAAALSSARLGDFGVVDAMTERCLAAQHPGLVRFAAGLGQVLTLVSDGKVAAAEDTARHYLGFADFEQPGRAIGETILGQVFIAKGDLPGAVAVLRQATAALKQTGYSWGPAGLMHLTRALGQLGDARAAAESLARAEASHGMRSEVYAPELGLARAWALAAARDIPGAVAAARTAVRVALRSGQRAPALLALEDAVRLGDGDAVDTALRIANEIDCALGPVVLRHARGVHARDGAELAAVSVELTRFGMICAAADAAAQAAVAFVARNNRRGELTAKERAAELARQCGEPSTPALEKVLRPLPLTGREREVAVMVAAGLTNKAIAERLSISVRTVEGHIYRGCIKLDVADRTMLALAVAAAVGTQAERMEAAREL
jgi:DNA-binding CsgD family transcriptional regulator